MESNLLRYLIQHEGRPVSRKKMIEEVWGLREDTDTRPIDNFIVRLRRYIEDDPRRPRHLITVRGVGYRFAASPAVEGDVAIGYYWSCWNTLHGCEYRFRLRAVPFSSQLTV